MGKIGVRYLFLAAFMIAAMLLPAGCGKEKRREIRLVTEPPYPPFEYYVGDKLTGIDIDIMQEIARRLDCELLIRPISFDMVMKSVISGEADVGISSISITEERKKLVDFSISYVPIGQMVVVPDQSPIRRFDQLHGKSIGVQEGTTGEAYVKEKYGHPVAYPNIEVASEALAGGKIDALVLDSIPAEELVANERYFRLLPGKLTEEHLGIAVNKKRPELLKQINAELGDMLKTGWIDRTVKRHVNHSRQRSQGAVQSVRQLKIGIVPTYPPYEMKRNGVLEGIDVEIIQRICDELGVAPAFVEISSDTICPSVADGDVTLVISSLSITEERRKLVDFSIPYSAAAQRIMVKNDSAFQCKADLKGKTLGVVTGTTSEEQGALISTEIERYSEPQLLLESLRCGEVDAVILDDFILKQLMRSGGFRLLPEILAKEEYGIAISKKEPELREKINRILLRMKQEGLLDKIHGKYINDKLSSVK